MTKTEKLLNTLLAELRNGEPRALELLASELISRLVGVRLSVARGGGFQHGGDGGTAGRGGRHLRIECKRYAEGTPLSDRELQGEVDDARRRTPGLEAWILVSTKEASENTQETLNLKAREVGVPIVVLDWASSCSGMPDLAALCAWASDLVTKHYGAKAGRAAKALAPFAGATVERIGRELESWRLGFENLRSVAADRVRAIWGNEADSRAALAQNVAGGAASALVERATALAALQEWWSVANGQLAVVHGAEGVGKTWATMQWMLRELDNLPLVLTVPSSAVRDLRTTTEGGVLEFLGGCLFDVARTQDRRYWNARVHQIFQRPLEQGPAMLLLIDGANQEPSFDWRRFVQILEAGCFKGRLRLLVTVQTHFLEERLHNMRGTTYGARHIGVEPYDVTPGGELEQMLALYGRALNSIAPDLLSMARIPRLFPLVMRLSAHVDFEGDVTVARLLWAHGRDELSLREGRAFSESEWEGWLLRLAESHWASIQAGATGVRAGDSYSLEQLEAMVTRQSYEPALNYRRLAEIIDGTWMESIPGKVGHFRPKEATINLALGAAVLGMLEDVEHQAAGNVELALAQWLDPIASTSAAADILAAAMSILVAKRLPLTSAIPSAIVTTLLQSQNAQDFHRREAVALAPALLHALMIATERSSSRAQASARHWALEALGSISKENLAAWQVVAERLVAWVAHVRCPSAADMARSDDAARHEADRLVKRIGSYAAGTHSVMGVPLVLREVEHEDLALHVPSLLLGKPLMLFMPVFAAAAVAAAVSVSSAVWEGLKWLVSLNPVDPEETVGYLAALSAVSQGIPGGAGVHSELPTRVAALLLWLTGVEEHERKAANMRVGFEGGISYEEHYLRNPTRSLFVPIEHRHLDRLWRDDGVALGRRLQMAAAYLPDPTLDVPKDFVRQIEAAADSFPVEKLDVSMSNTAEDHDFEGIQPGLARLAPRALASLIRKWYCGLPSRSRELRHWAALRLTRHLLLAGASEAAAVKAMRLNRPNPEDSDEKILAMSMLEVELWFMELDDQLDALVEADCAFLSLQLLDVLRRPDDKTIESFLSRWGVGNRRALEVLFNYVARYPVPLERTVFDELVGAAFPEDKQDDLKTVAFLGLARANPGWFGEVLIARAWSATIADNYFEQELGSRAIFAARPAAPLRDLRSIVAPWCLLIEARARGGAAIDSNVAADALGAAIHANGFEPSHPGVDISIDVSRRHAWVSFDPPERSSGDEASLQDAFDFDAQHQRHRNAREEGTDFIRRAMDAGALMATARVSLEDARLLLTTCSAEVDLWLEGCNEPSQAFRFRVNRAAGLFLSFCEVLLETDWKRGVSLWRALDQSLTINFVGRGGINEMKLMLFRAPENAGVLTLRAEIFSLARNLTDSSYLDIAVCVLLTKNQAWLKSKIEADTRSNAMLRKKRAVLMQGFLENASALPTWPIGFAVGGLEWLSRRAQSWINRASFSRHWWRQFLLAKDLTNAYAAWHVFLNCADRTALAWIDIDLRELGEDDGDDLSRIKSFHIEANWSTLANSMKEKESKGHSEMTRHLLGWESPDRWFTSRQLTETGY
ncbi:MAG: hypothetical protein JNK71_04420 [Methyloversatilis sp.]|nr:hypothetical protein [Methyloversatilis sp.]